MDKEENVLEGWQDEDEKLDDKAAKKIVRKTRLSLIFTVLRTLIGVFLIFTFYMIAIGTYFQFSGGKDKFERFVTTVVETRYHGMSVEKHAHHETEITPLFTKKTSLPLYRQVGSWNVIVGNVEAKKSLFGNLRLKFNYNNKYLDEPMTHTYAISPDLLGDEVRETGEEKYLLDQLNKISDGFVTQMHFSLKESMSPQDLLEILDAYDVSVLEMPLYTGELSEGMDMFHYYTGDNYYFASTLKLRPIVYYDGDRLSGSVSALSGEGVLEDSLEKIEEDLEWLVDHGGYHDEDLDKKRLKYFRDNETRVIGAVVTGPIREIERLVEENDFHQHELGGIEVWNWY
ncbi:anti sigma factor C-terminal domain-containing protein [Oceanobacillus sp. CAU 1775]